MGKREDAARQTRANIIHAAKELHDARGLSAVSVDDIVAAANVSKGTFYIYFKRKEDVAYEIAFQHYEDLKKSLESFKGNSLDKLKHFLVKSVQYIEAQGLALCKQWMKSAVSPSDSDESGIRKLHFDQEFVSATLAEAKQRGEISASAEYMADVIMTEYYGSVTLWSMTNGKFPMYTHMQEFAEKLGDLLNLTREG